MVTVPATFLSLRPANVPVRLSVVVVDDELDEVEDGVESDAEPAPAVHPERAAARASAAAPRTMVLRMMVGSLVRLRRAGCCGGMNVTSGVSRTAGPFRSVKIPLHRPLHPRDSVHDPHRSALPRHDRGG